MKKQNSAHKLLSMLLAFVMVFSMAAVGTMPFAAAAKVNVKKVQVTNLTGKTLYVAKGKTVKLSTKVTVTPNKATNKKVTYTSKNKKIAAVNAKGVVSGKKVGTTKITVASKSNKAKKTTFTVKVTTPVKSVKLNKPQTTMTVGATKSLSVTVSPSKACKKVTWSSNNTKVATVSAKGVVTAKAAGTAKITAKAIDGTGKKATVTINVQKKTASAPASTPTPTLLGLESMTFDKYEYQEAPSKILVKLNAPKALTKSDFVVKKKRNAQGVYNYTVAVDQIQALDQQTYLLLLSEDIYRGEYCSVTVSALPGKKTLEICNQEKVIEQEFTRIFEVGDSYGFSISDYSFSGYTTTKLISGTLPAGFELDENSLYANYTPTAPVNKQKFVFSITDELGITVNSTYIITVVDRNTIAVDDITIGALDDWPISMGETGEFYVSGYGGSGAYDFTLVNDENGAFKVNTDDSGANEVCIDYDTNKLPRAGTYTLLLKTTDREDPARSVLSNITFIVQERHKINLTIPNMEDAENIVFVNRQNGRAYYAVRDEQEVYVNVPAGAYDVYASLTPHDVLLEHNLKISGPTTLSLAVPATYPISGTITDMDGQPINSPLLLCLRSADPSVEHGWEFTVEDGSYAVAAVLPGRYTLEIAVQDPWTERNVILKTEQFNIVNAPVTLTSKITLPEESAPATDYTMTGEGTKRIALPNGSDYVLLAFTPTETSWYEITSDGVGDPRCYLLDEDAMMIAESDDDNDMNFIINVHLEANKTYYLKMKDYSGISFDLHIAKTEAPEEN